MSDVLLTLGVFYGLVAIFFAGMACYCIASDKDDLAQAPAIAWVGFILFAALSWPVSLFFIMRKGLVES